MDVVDVTRQKVEFILQNSQRNEQEHALGIDLFHGRRRHCVAWQNPRNPHMRIGWLVGK
jgi:hypothetical protein